MEHQERYMVCYLLMDFYFVAGIGLLALIDGMANNPGDNIAHFAHLGGMIFGLLILRLWKKQNNLY